MKLRALLVLVAALGALSPALAGGCSPARAPERPLDDGGVDSADADADADDADASDASDASDADADADASADSGGDAAGPPRAAQGACPEGMAALDDQVCIDRWEASLVVVAPDGALRAHPHNLTPADTDDVRAVSRPGVLPQTYISALQAADACAASDKRLCTEGEWARACEGAGRLTYPYAAKRAAGTCNDDGRSAIGVVFPGALLAHAPLASGARPSRGAKGSAGGSSKARPGAPGKGGKAGKKAGKADKAGKASAAGKGGRPAKPRAGPGSTHRAGSAPGRRRRHPPGPAPGVDPAVWTRLNDPRLGEVPGTFALTGERALCRNELEVYDLVGNAHEWVADELPNGRGMFAGGYYLDVLQNGEGCHYRTTAHARSYHDYSTGFRCCKDLGSE